MLCSPTVILSKNKTNTLLLPSNHPPCSANIQPRLHSATSPSLCLSLSKRNTHTHTLSCLVGRRERSCIIHPLKQLQQPALKGDMQTARTHADMMRYLWLIMAVNKLLAKNTYTEKRKAGKYLDYDIKLKLGTLNYLTPP